MNIAAALLPLALFIYLLIPTAVLGVAEYFLSKTASPWPGRVLPILSAFFSVCIAALLLFQLAADSPFPAVLLPLAALVILNLPTAVFLIIHRCTRRAVLEKKGIEKMNIQDL
ncbi:hypothetical protein [Intestinimonas butyriciproducens]|uniref:Uncharacterized protein n=1 Tax=Intestinimonas butyriciproducens TaxID=1297617 RepID=A0A2U1CD66_9FIRM|nr:hypothetical protein [Intestinimonas butyriciproducens]MCR1905809.1 hypothetical protein [Intestinimonas butyriciproducens]MDB7861953.1 hypothetical protein [Intestinimonas butyriciproducens]MDB7863184.1 hypothetical protein [Intestinimonas butyriciproducens]PVY58868.1 hypothetical protein C7373_103156 [Intestinimonas butyriciproducens]QBB66516.1 hypothetical protein SRB521_02257 [Intestinimonas butyriciproducens]